MCVRYSPSSRVLFVSICSLTKAAGGDDGYDAHHAVVTGLNPRLARRLLWHRERALKLVQSASDVKWQGVALPELEYNRDLCRGSEFGGDGRARYLPAAERYQGRFFLGLGPDGLRALRASRHHMLLLSGLYGVLRPFEPIQLYSCPLDASIAQLWREENVLTDIVSDYVVREGIERIVDLTAIDAYRRLIDWDEVSGYGVQVLHCFHAMGAGDYALIPFGKVMGKQLLGMPDAELLALEPEHRMESIVFRALTAPGSGFPDEAAAIAASQPEEDIVETHAIEAVSEVLGGGNPKPSGSGGGGEWRFAALSKFRKDVWRQPNLFERVANAIVEICKDPMTSRGNTVKRLKGGMSGYWRYRLGDFRLVYRPDNDRLTVFCYRLAPRGGVYD